MATAHILGFPRIGSRREMKFAVEKYWKGQISQKELQEEGQRLRKSNFLQQQNKGLDFVTVGDFSWYDHVLDTSVMLGAVPPRFGHDGKDVALDTFFRMARGRAPTGTPQAACEMTKWFDTNYHYIVPEFYKNQEFKLSSTKLFDEIKEATTLGMKVKPVILGPISYLWLGKAKDEGVDKIALLDKLIPVYNEILNKIKDLGCEWVQIDEPILTLELSKNWLDKFEPTYHDLAGVKINKMLTTYFGAIDHNISAIANLPVEGLHIDLVRGESQLTNIIDRLPAYKALSLGVVNGRNIWKSNLSAILGKLEDAKSRLQDRLWVSSSCSLLHSPVDLSIEDKLDNELKDWLGFGAQKIEEIVVLTKALNDGPDSVAHELKASDKSANARINSKRIHKSEVKQRMAALTDDMANRKNVYSIRAKAQKDILQLPDYPTTTIGSFPQTTQIRHARKQFKSGEITEEEYTTAMQNEIRHVVKKQEEYGLDVLVHGEPERNDMVEYFGELLDGFAFTKFGWVQSYGSRCVKPPIIYGDVTRPKAMTVEWSTFAKSLTDKPMKGMLTGPVTILCWSFVRDDQPKKDTSMQIALALRDEVVDLEKNGIKVIQIDEPAFREGLPLKSSEQPEYLAWAVKSFRVATTGVEDSTQIHTHMCYSEFNELIEYIADMDADVITIESSRSDMELLQAFEDFAYPNEIGPGVYDIHSPNVPDVKAMVDLMQKASKRIPKERLWVNPDCGLKTRGWEEVDESMRNMVQAAKELRG